MTSGGVVPSSAVASPRARVASARSRGLVAGLPLLLVASIGLVTITVGRVHELLPSLTGSLPLGKVFVALGLLALVLGADTRQRLRAYGTRHGRLLLGAGAAMVVSIPFSIYVGGSVSYALGILPQSAAIGLVLTAAATSSSHLEALMRALVLALALMGNALLLGMGQAIRDTHGLRYSISLMYDPNDVALLAVVTLPFAVMVTRDRGWFWRIMGMLAISGIVAIVLKSQSRGGLITLVVTTLPLLLSRRSPIPAWARATCAVLSLSAVTLLPREYLERASTIFNPSKDYNTTAENGRLALAKRALGHIATHPITGVGFGQFPTAEGQWARRNLRERGFMWMQAHNMYLQAATEIGLPGAAALFSVLVLNVRLGRRARRLRRRGVITKADVERAAALSRSTMAFLVGGLFLSAAFSPLMVLLTALGLGYSQYLAVRIREHGETLVPPERTAAGSRRRAA